MSGEPTPQRKDIKAAKVMKQLMTVHFQGLNEASKSNDTKVAWCTSVGPAELLRAFDFEVYFPENHGAMLGTTRRAMDYIPSANAIGYSPDICSYLTSDVGAYLKKETPLTDAFNIENIPKPDVLAYNTNQCRDVQEWFNYYGNEFDIPVIGIEPPKYIGALEESYIKDVEEQFKNLVPVLEKTSGLKFSEEKLKSTLRLSHDATLLWKEVLDTATNIPSPLTFFDGTIHMGPIVVMRGTPEAVEYYRLLKSEMEERVKNKIGAVEGERFRLYWDGMPIWGKLSAFAKQFLSLKSCVAASTYCNSWVFDSFDPENPFYSMAKAYTEIFINRNEEYKEKYIINLIKEFKINGVIFHDSKTCPNNSNSRYGMPERLKNKYNIPTLVINGDLNDLRCYSEEQTRTNIEAFIEQLAEGE
jgi:benzoyl-CoA reductase/2-hydroxyglutaryl-CoA dehydratase subunit BcrC/BadD/HgdB